MEQGTPDESHQWIFSRVLGDGFHLMDHVKVPMRHDFKAAYFRALRAALFIHDSGDLERVKRVLQKKNQKLSHVLAWKYSYIALRVKQRIPPPNILYARVKAVFDFFMYKQDSQTNQYIPHLGTEKVGVARSVHRSTSVRRTIGILWHECRRFTIIVPK